jgi:hypothetical protein
MLSAVTLLAGAPLGIEWFRTHVPRTRNPSASEICASTRGCARAGRVARLRARHSVENRSYVCYGRVGPPVQLAAGTYFAPSPIVMFSLAFHCCEHVSDAHRGSRISAVPRRRSDDDAR